MKMKHLALFVLVLAVACSAQVPSDRLQPKSAGGTLYANNLRFASTTCGVAEAYNLLPADGGKIELGPGTCTATSQIVFQKPITLEGECAGGFKDGVVSVLWPCSQLVNGSSNSDLIVIGNCATGVEQLSGVTLRDFSILGNSASGTGGSNIKICGGNNNSTNYVRGVKIQNVVTAYAKQHGLDIENAAYELDINQVYSVRNSGNGFEINGSASATPSSIRFNESECDLNAGYGLRVDYAGGDVSFHQSLCSDSQLDGLSYAGGLGALFVSESHLEHNKGFAVSLPGGAGHSISLSTLTSNTGGGISVTTNSAVGANISWNIFSANAGADIVLGATSHNVTIGPQGTSYTLSNNSTSGNILNPAVFHFYNDSTRGTGYWITGVNAYIRLSDTSTTGKAEGWQSFSGQLCMINNSFSRPVCLSDGGTYRGTSVSLSGTLGIGNGSTINADYKGSGILTYTSIVSASSCQEQPLKIIGVLPGDACFASTGSQDIGSSYYYGGCRVSAANTAQIKVCATVAGTPNAVMWTAWAFH